jgi:regulator of nonsense transcripts 1
LNQKRVAWFYFRKLESGEVRLVVGDELRLRYQGELHKAWDGVGHVIKIPNSKLYVMRQGVELIYFLDISDEIRLELRRTEGIPTDCDRFCLEIYQLR